MRSGYREHTCLDRGAIGRGENWAAFYLEVSVGDKNGFNSRSNDASNDAKFALTHFVALGGLKGEQKYKFNAVSFETSQ